MDGVNYSLDFFFLESINVVSTSFLCWFMNILHKECNVCTKFFVSLRDPKQAEAPKNAENHDGHRPGPRHDGNPTRDVPSQLLKLGDNHNKRQ